MATFSGGTSPAVLAALAPSINNLAAAQQAKSQAASGLLNTINLNIEKKRQLDERKQKNQAAQMVAEGLLKDPGFVRQVPGVTDSAELVKLVGADNVIKYGIDARNADRLETESRVRLRESRQRIRDMKADRDVERINKNSSQNLQLILPDILRMKEGEDPENMISRIERAGMNTPDTTTALNAVDARVGIKAQTDKEKLDQMRAVEERLDSSVDRSVKVGSVLSGVQDGTITRETLSEQIVGLPANDIVQIYSAMDKKDPIRRKPEVLEDLGDGKKRVRVYLGNNNSTIVTMDGPLEDLTPTAKSRLAAFEALNDQGLVLPSDYELGKSKILLSEASGTDPFSGLPGDLGIELRNAPLLPGQSPAGMGAVQPMGQQQLGESFPSSAMPLAPQAEQGIPTQQPAMGDSVSSVDPKPQTSFPADVISVYSQTTRDLVDKKGNINQKELEGFISSLKQDPNANYSDEFFQQIRLLARRESETIIEGLKPKQDESKIEKELPVRKGKDFISDFEEGKSTSLQPQDLLRGLPFREARPISLSPATIPKNRIDGLGSGALEASLELKNRLDRISEMDSISLILKAKEMAKKNFGSASGPYRGDDRKKILSAIEKTFSSDLGFKGEIGKKSKVDTSAEIKARLYLNSAITNLLIRFQNQKALESRRSGDYVPRNRNLNPVESFKRG